MQRLLSLPSSFPRQRKGRIILQHYVLHTYPTRLFDTVYNRFTRDRLQKTLEVIDPVERTSPLQPTKLTTNGFRPIYPKFPLHIFLLLEDPVHHVQGKLSEGRPLYTPGRRTVNPSGTTHRNRDRSWRDTQSPCRWKA